MKKIIFNFFLILIFLLINISFSQAGVIAEGKITRISNISQNQDAFAIYVEGTGICSNQYIPFFIINFPNNSSSAYNRAYTNALLSFLTGAKVKIYNYNNDDCNGASYIELKEE